MSAKFHGWSTFVRDHFTQAHSGFAVGGELRDGGVGQIAIEHRHHADPAIERAQHLRLADAARGGEPLEYRQYGNAGEVDVDPRRPSAARAECFQQSPRR